MSANEAKLLEKLRQLPPEKVTEVEDFVDFLAGKARRQAALDRLRALRERVPGTEIGEDEMQEIVAAVRAVRAERRA
jgi:hypothetical protein